MKRLILLACLLFLCSCAAQPTAGQNGEKSYGWGFGRNKSTNEPEFTATQVSMMNEFNCLFRGDPSQKNLYLTFDCGYEYENLTADILDTLAKTNVKAAFFITGQYLTDNENLVKRMVDEGHIVGGHTLKHPSLPEVSDARITEELTGFASLMRAKFNYEVKYTRPPKGEYSRRTLKLAQELGFRDVFWSFAYADWETNKQKGADYAFNKITTGVKNGAVILLHAVSRDNAQSLERVIEFFQADGYQFLTLNEYV